MVSTVIDRGGDVAADTVPSSDIDSPVARSGGWGNIALIGAGVGLLGTMGGLMIGYSAFHQSASTASAAQPAKASERSVDDVMGSANAQRAALAGQLGQPNAAQTDVFGRPITPAAGTQVADANANPVSATTTASNGQQSPAQRRAEQARAMADAARRSPIMAFGNTGTASAVPGAGRKGSKGGPKAMGRVAGNPRLRDKGSAQAVSGRRVTMRRLRRQRARPISTTSSATPRSRPCAPPWSPTETCC